MTRVKVIKDEYESADIVKSILSLGQPIGVDCEGVQLPTLGLVQVKAQDNQIYLFRTGINAKLFIQGGLKELLENQNIVKVMHAAAGDCLGIYKENVNMWPLYDTSIAHKIINYQNGGFPLGSK